MEPKYYAKQIEEIKGPAGTWSCWKIGVFRRMGHYLKDEQVGEYRRNYHTLYDTFCWFMKDGKDYALYSPDYTATRILELPSCKDLGGEEPKSHGFCPVEFYVPSHTEFEWASQEESFKSLNGKRFKIYEADLEEWRGKETKLVAGPLHDSFGFVAGCIWGDDCSWKVQFLDLSEADKGKLIRDERFGYVELPRKQKLRDAIDMEDGRGYFTMAREDTYDLKTGRCTSHNSLREILAKGGLKKPENGSFDPKVSYSLTMTGEDLQWVYDNYLQGSP